jgi:hypothetical protein
VLQLFKTVQAVVGLVGELIREQVHFWHFGLVDCLPDHFVRRFVGIRVREGIRVRGLRWAARLEDLFAEKRERQVYQEYIELHFFISYYDVKIILSKNKLSFFKYFLNLIVLYY